MSTDRLGVFEERLGFRALHHALLVIGVWRAGMDFHRIGGKCREARHIGWQHFELDLDLFRRRAGMILGIGRDDRYGIAELEHLILAEDRTIPAVAFIGGEGDKAGDGVLALHIPPGDDLNDTRHRLGFGVDALDESMGDLCLHERQAQRILWHLQRNSAPKSQAPVTLANADGR